MFKFISGVTMGIYLGTYYDLKPKIKEIHKFIASQWSADSDFGSVRAEKPAIIAALKQMLHGFTS